MIRSSERMFKVFIKYEWFYNTMFYRKRFELVDELRIFDHETQKIINGYDRNNFIKQNMYKHVTIRVTPEYSDKFSEHRLIYIMHKGLIPYGYMINHLNGLKGDNRIENLELVIESDNIRHGYRTGLSVTTEKARKLSSERWQGFNNNNSQFTEKDILNIIDLCKQGLSFSEIGNMYKVTHHPIADICHGVSYKEITKGIDVTINSERSIINSKNIRETSIIDSEEGLNNFLDQYKDRKPIELIHKFDEKVVKIFRYVRNKYNHPYRLMEKMFKTDHRRINDICIFNTYKTTGIDFSDITDKDVEEYLRSINSDYDIYGNYVENISTFHL